MHKGKLDGFCLVSSDSDFTRLAQRLREDGLVVYGFGERKTPEAFRNACNQFRLRCENYGCQNLSTLVRETGAFDTQTRPGNAMYVKRMKTHRR